MASRRLRVFDKRPLFTIIVATTISAAPIGCRLESSAGPGATATPIARSGSESWTIAGKHYSVVSTYYLALPEGFQFTIEYEALSGSDPTTLTDADAF